MKRSGFEYRHCSRLSSSLPIVNIRRQFDGFPSLMQDDYQGMRDAMAHLIEKHGYQRIAYIRGEESNGPCQIGIAPMSMH